MLSLSDEQEKVLNRCNAFLLTVEPIYFVHKVERNLVSENDHGFGIEFSCKSYLLSERAFSPFGTSITVKVREPFFSLLNMS